MTETMKGEPGIRQLPGPCWTVLLGDEGAGFEGAMYHYLSEQAALDALPDYRIEEEDDDDRARNARLRVVPVDDVAGLVCWEAYLLCGEQFVHEVDDAQSHFTDRDEVLSMIAEDGLMPVRPDVFACDSDVCQVCIPVRRKVKQQLAVQCTHPSVFAVFGREGWADPVGDPTEIDWYARRKTAAILFQIVDGRPVNPYGWHLPYGRGKLGHWGEKKNADAAVFVTVGGIQCLLLGERGDGNGWALPGGGLEGDESAFQGALRELFEETGVRIDLTVSGSYLWWDQLKVRYVPDPRASREAWMVTTPIVVALGPRDDFPVTECASDLARCAWVPCRGGLARVEREVTALGGKLFESHREMQTEILRLAAA